MDPKDIESGKYYSARQVAKMGILPWRSAATFGKALRDDRWKAIFNPVADQKKNAVRFHIKGESVLKFVEMARNGELNG